MARIIGLPRELSAAFDSEAHALMPLSGLASARELVPLAARQAG
jgi:hypothetical protein